MIHLQVQHMASNFAIPPVDERREQEGESFVGQTWKQHILFLTTFYYEEFTWHTCEENWGMQLVVCSGGNRTGLGLVNSEPASVTELTQPLLGYYL